MCSSAHLQRKELVKQRDRLEREREAWWPTSLDMLVDEVDEGNRSKIV